MSYTILNNQKSSGNIASDNSNNNTFEYTYSADRQREIESIRKKYLPKEEDKLETLRRLDRSAEKPGTIISLVIGIIGALIMGAGMSCVMVGKGMVLFVVGIIVGIIGMGIAAAAYPVYIIVTKRHRKRITAEILALTEELSV